MSEPGITRRISLGPRSMCERLRSEQARHYLPHAAVMLFVVWYAALWGASGLRHLNPTDLDIFFMPGARLALAGHPLAIYQIRAGGGIYPNWGAGTADWFVLISQTYFGAWRLTTPTQIALRYAPSSDGNQPYQYGRAVDALMAQWEGN